MKDLLKSIFKYIRRQIRDAFKFYWYVLISPYLILVGVLWLVQTVLLAIVNTVLSIAGKILEKRYRGIKKPYFFYAMQGGEAQFHILSAINKGKSDLEVAETVRKYKHQLDPRTAMSLINWVSDYVKSVPLELRKEIARDIFKLGELFHELRYLERDSNLIIAITCYELFIDVFLDRESLECAIAHLRLGDAYREYFYKKEYSLPISTLAEDLSPLDRLKATATKEGADVFADPLGRLAGNDRRTHSFPTHLEVSSLYYQKALNYFQSENIEREKGLALVGIGLLSVQAGAIRKALNSQEEALSILEMGGYTSDLVDAQLSISRTYLSDKKPLAALPLIQSALDKLEEGTHSHKWADAMYELGITHLFLGSSVDQALSYFHACLEVYSVEDSPRDCLKVGERIGEIGYIKGDWEKVVEGYSLAVDSAEEIRWFIKYGALKSRIASENFSAYSSVIEGLVRLCDLDKAIEYAERSRSALTAELIAARESEWVSDQTFSKVQETAQILQNSQYEWEQKYGLVGSLLHSARGASGTHSIYEDQRFLAEQTKDFTLSMQRVLALDRYIGNKKISLSPDVKKMRETLESKVVAAIYIVTSGCWHIVFDLEEEWNLCTFMRRGRGS